MGIYEHWPYVNFHELNTNWLIEEIPKVYASRDEAQASAEASAESAAASQLSADASQASADASQLSAEASQRSAADSQESAEASAASELSAKNYAEHIADPVAGIVTTWLADHITNPTNPPIDTSLTVAGAAADAKSTGDELIDLKTALTVASGTAELTWTQGNIRYSDGVDVTSTTRIRTDPFTAPTPLTIYVDFDPLFKYTYRVYDAKGLYIPGRGPEQLHDNTDDIVLDTGESIRFIVGYATSGMSITPETETGFICRTIQVTDISLTMPNKSADAKVVGKRFAELSSLENKVNSVILNDYQLYTPTFILSPSAIENNGNLINTISGTKTTDYIDCSGWKGIRYTGSSWLVCRALAFYDENHTWILSYPATGDTTEYVNEIIDIPTNAKYVIFADLTAKQSQTLRIEVATEYKIAGKWTGKKWTCVGDSLTEHNLRSDMNYHDYVANATGISVVNMGRSGTGYKRTYDEGYAFYQRISSVPTDSDVVTIFGSGNDLLYIDNLGTPTDSGSSDNPATICGCINKTIDTLIALMPTVQLGIVAPTPWKGEQPTLDNSNAMGRYVEALRQICYIRSIPFLDLYHESNLRPWTEEGRQACYSKDGNNGTHPDEEGHKIIASRFEGFLDTLLLT